MVQRLACIEERIVDATLSEHALQTGNVLGDQRSILRAEIIGNHRHALARLEIDEVGAVREREFELAPVEYVKNDDVVPLAAEIRERVEDRIHWEYGKQTGTLLDEDEPAPSVDFSDIENKYRAKIADRKHEGDRFSDAKQHITVLFVETGEFTTGATKFFSPLNLPSFAIALIPPLAVSAVNLSMFGPRAKPA